VVDGPEWAESVKEADPHDEYFECDGDEKTVERRWLGLEPL
jgi:hypothetical protein